jgi:hypothetical protein
MNRELRRRLIEAAASKRDEFVHYDEVARILGISTDRLDHCPEMNDALDDISTYEHEHGRPLLSAIVVHKPPLGDLRPGSGFFKMAKGNGRMRRGEEKDEFYIPELGRLRAYWRGRGGEGR